MNAEDLIQVLIEVLENTRLNFDSKKRDIFDNYDGINEVDQKILDKKGIGSVEIVEEDRCGSDYDRWYRIMYFPKHNIYLCHIGYYNSNDGEYFGEPSSKVLYEVKKKEIVVTQFSPIRICI